MFHIQLMNIAIVSGMAKYLFLICCSAERYNSAVIFLENNPSCINKTDSKSIINNRTGPNGLYNKLSIKSPFKILITDLVEPQEGQGTPDILFIMHPVTWSLVPIKPDACKSIQMYPAEQAVMSVM